MDATALPPPQPAWRRYLPDALLLLVLLVLALKLSYHISTVRDLGTDDETYYLANGHYVATWGLPKACYSPLYVLWYWGWDQLHLERAAVYYANWTALLYLLAAGGYVLVRVLGGYRVVALGFAFLVLTSGLGDVWPYPMHLATVVLLLGTAIAARLRTWTASLFTLAASLAVASYMRPEFALAFLTFCPVCLACAAWTAWRHRAARLRVLLLSSLLGAFVAGLAAVFGNPFAGGKAFYAFGAHYALNVWAHGWSPMNIDPWTNWEALTRADFGDATTVTGALYNNPRAFFWHVGCNLAHLPRTLAEIMGSSLVVQTGKVYLNLALAAVALVGLVGLLRRVIRRTGADDPAARPLRVTLVMLLCLGVTAAPSVVLVWPRAHYLIPLAVFAGGLAFAGYRGFADLVPRLRRTDAAVLLVAAVLFLILITPNRAHRWSLQQRLRHSWKPTVASMEVQRTVAALRGLDVHPAKPIVVLEPDFSRAFYAGWDGLVVLTTWKKVGFEQFLKDLDIGVIVLNERLLIDTRFRDDPAFLDFVAGKNSAFRFFDVPATKVRLAVRADLLSPSAPAAQAAR